MFKNRAGLTVVQARAACTGPQIFWGPKFYTFPYIEILNLYEVMNDL
jgi:hypothetical protein